MCPSYMVTLEEEHSTRGRAHMLFELLQGEVIDGGWKNEQVKQALDLCLACKACKSECPANVDLATYKAEFLSHYYEGKRRPLHAYAFGMIDRWAALGSFAPSVANLLSNAPRSKRWVQKTLELAPQREMPQLAAVRFQKWAAKQRSAKDGGPAVVLWPDTFNNYFKPETSQAAFEVLTHAGFNVMVPRSHLCCGRPLYDFGMLDRAKKYLQRTMRVLAPEIDAGLPIVILEPSCASVFRDELQNLFPEDARADRLRRQTFLLSEFLQQHAYQPPQLSQKLLLHGHCHHKAIMKMTAEEELLRKMGADLKTLDAGCCGMAGPFGFEQKKYAVSQAIGERVLLPAVRHTDPDTLIVSDGFSCREQVLHATGRTALHLAEVLQRALHQQ
jgi:Fe-S oxidoreductase